MLRFELCACHIDVGGCTLLVPRLLLVTAVAFPREISIRVAWDLVPGVSFRAAVGHEEYLPTPSSSYRYLVLPPLLPLLPSPPLLAMCHLSDRRRQRFLEKHGKKMAGD